MPFASYLPDTADTAEREKAYAFVTSQRGRNAIYKVDKLVLVNCDIFEQYLEAFRISE